jgi:hypothetical protein
MMDEGLMDSAARWTAHAAHRAWTTLRVAHTAHSPGDGCGVVLFLIVKWACFSLSKFA